MLDKMQKLPSLRSMHVLFIIICLSLIIVLIKVSECSSQSGPRIAVIGGGISGASSAHFLADAFGERATIHVFDEGVNLGGRTAVLELNGHQFESGGTIIHDKNLYMKYFAKLLGLQARYETEEMRLAVFDGEKVALDTSDWYLVKMMQLLRRYGISCFVSLKNVVTSMLSDFSRIYSHQNKGAAFSSVESLLESMSARFPEMAKQTIEDYLIAEGFPSNFIHELVAGAMRNNYGQNVSIHAFVGAVSLAGAEGGLWTVKGGNRQIAEGLLTRLESQLPDQFRRFTQRVTRLTAAAGGSKWQITTSDSNVNIYDFVILATPCHQKFNIEVVGATVPRTEFQQTVATFVKGRLNHDALQLQSKSVRYNLLTGTPQAELIFNSIGFQFDVNGQPADSVYKIFSQNQLSSSQLNSLFNRVTSSSHVTWLAYPKYSIDNLLNSSFVLAPGLYYTSPIELAASAMEMSALSGRNAALLLYNSWSNRTELTDPKSLPAKAADTVLLRKGEL